MRRWSLLFALVACSPGPDSHHCPGICDYDAPPSDGPVSVCNPLTQAGCSDGQKCTWIVDQTLPQYVGHIGCEPDGTAALGATCMFGAPGATGFDNCERGTVCSSFATFGNGTCKAICDNRGGIPMCGSDQACASEQPLFAATLSSPAAGGLCEPLCDPLADNDFDGPGSALSRTGTTCGSADIGCYGAPSFGQPPRTQFYCQPDLHYTTPLHHRTECTPATGCITSGGLIQLDSCNQGYEPLLRESLAVSTTICVALCAPAECYAGNCGSNNANRLGAAPHRCESPDALGAFGSAEECEYLWREEIAGSNTWLPSPYSDRVGLCVDRAAYGEPSCATVPLHNGGGSDADAVSLGCVNSQAAGLVRP